MLIFTWYGTFIKVYKEILEWSLIRLLFFTQHWFFYKSIMVFTSKNSSSLFKVYLHYLSENSTNYLITSPDT